jgi:hypothetical protein
MSSLVLRGVLSPYTLCALPYNLLRIGIFSAKCNCSMLGFAIRSPSHLRDYYFAPVRNNASNAITSTGGIALRVDAFSNKWDCANYLQMRMTRVWKRVLRSQ